MKAFLLLCFLLATVRLTARDYSLEEKKGIIVGTTNEQLVALKAWCEAHPLGGTWVLGDGTDMNVSKEHRDAIRPIVDAEMAARLVGAKSSPTKAEGSTLAKVADDVWKTSSGERLKQALEFERAGNFEAAVRIFQETASSGFPEGLYRLGLCHTRATGVPYMKWRGIAMIRRAAEAGVAEAQLELAILISSETGLSADATLRIEAMKWAMLAADKLPKALEKVAYLRANVLTAEDYRRSEVKKKEWRVQPIKVANPFDGIPDERSTIIESAAKVSVAPIHQESQLKPAAPVAELITGEDVKMTWLSYRKGSTYQGKSGRLLKEFQDRVRAGVYDMEAQVEACKWNVKELNRVGELKLAANENEKLADISFKLEQLNLQRRQAIATEGAAAAARDAAAQLNQINWELFNLR